MVCISAYYLCFFTNSGFLSGQAQQLFQRDAQTITPEALESVKAALANSDIEHKAETKKKAIPRKAAGQTWEDPSLAEWPESTILLLSLFNLFLLRSTDLEGIPGHSGERTPLSYHHSIWTRS